MGYNHSSVAIAAGNSPFSVVDPPSGAAVYAYNNGDGLLAAVNFQGIGTNSIAPSNVCLSPNNAYC